MLINLTLQLLKPNLTNKFSCLEVKKEKKNIWLKKKHKRRTTDKTQSNVPNLHFLSPPPPSDFFVLITHSTIFRYLPQFPLSNSCTKFVLSSLISLSDQCSNCNRFGVWIWQSGIFRFHCGFLIFEAIIEERWWRNWLKESGFMLLFYCISTINGSLKVLS